MKLSQLLSIAVAAILLSGCIKDPTTSIRRQADLQQAGAGANNILSDEKFTHLSIEFLVMPGVSISDEVYADARDFVNQYANKPDGIELFETQIESSGNDVYTLEQIVNIENNNRALYTGEQGSNSFAISVLVLDGEYQEENVLGIAYGSSSVALMGKVIDDNSGGLFRPSASVLYRSVLRHELGHLFGLVDNGSPMVDDHLDREHGAHCDNQECLMYFSTETLGFLEGVSGGEIPELDSECQADLKANGGK